MKHLPELLEESRYQCLSASVKTVLQCGKGNTSGWEPNEHILYTQRKTT